MAKSRNRIIGAIGAMVLAAISILAQSGTSRLSGTVADANGAPIEGAKVTVTKY